MPRPLDLSKPEFHPHTSPHQEPSLLDQIPGERTFQQREALDQTAPHRQAEAPLTSEEKKIIDQLVTFVEAKRKKDAPKTQKEIIESAKKIIEELKSKRFKDELKDIHPDKASTLTEVNIVLDRWKEDKEKAKKDTKLMEAISEQALQHLCVLNNKYQIIDRMEQITEKHSEEYKFLDKLLSTYESTLELYYDKKCYSDFTQNFRIIVEETDEIQRKLFESSKEGRIPEKFLQDQLDTVRESWGLVRKIVEMHEKLLDEHKQGRISDDVLKDQRDTIQDLQNIMLENWNAMQKTDDIENNPENANLSQAQQENLRKTVQSLREWHRECFNSYGKALQNLLEIQLWPSPLNEIEQKYREIMPKHCNIQKEVCKFQIKLTSIVLSLAQRENWKPHESYRSQYNNLFRWSQCLDTTQRILFQPSRVEYVDLTRWDADLKETQSIVCEEVDKITKAYESLLDQTQECKDISEREQKTLRIIREDLRDILKKVVPKVSHMDYLYRPHEYNYLFKEKYLEVLEKYPEFLDQSPHTPKEMSQQVREMCKENLERLADSYKEILGMRKPNPFIRSNLDYLLKIGDSRAKLIKALAAPHLWQANTQDTRWTNLQDWKKSVYKLIKAHLWQANAQDTRWTNLQDWKKKLDEAEEACKNKAKTLNELKIQDDLWKEAKTLEEKYYSSLRSSVQG